jgi:hypothetical protein
MPPLAVIDPDHGRGSRGLDIRQRKNPALPVRLHAVKPREAQNETMPPSRPANEKGQAVRISGLSFCLSSC